MKFWYLFLFSFSFGNFFSQDFELKKDKVTIPFQNFSNLMMLKVEMNEHKSLNFLLDTGSSSIIVFDKTLFSEEELQKGNRISIKGLGLDSTITALKLFKNKVKLHRNFSSEETDIIVIDNAEFNLSSKFGIPIHGIIGNSVFEDFVLSLHYSKGKIGVSKTLPKTSKYLKDTLIIAKNKPFLEISLPSILGEEKQELLIDTGGFDSFWFLEEDLIGENKSIQDFLGFGLAGEILGQRTIMNDIHFNQFQFNAVYTAFPEHKYISYLHSIYPNRKGSVGADFLHRFNWIFDYKNHAIYCQKNKNFKKAFYYNLVGFEVHKPFQNLDLYLVESVIIGSNADLAGILPDDIIIKLDGVSAHHFNVNEIRKYLSNPKRKKISVTLERNGKTFETTILLQNNLF